MTAVRAIIRDPRIWLQDAAFTAAMALTLALLGPFGSFDLPFAERLAQNFLYGFASFALLWQPMRLALHYGGRARVPELLVLVAGLSVLTVPVTLVCGLVAQSLDPGAGDRPFGVAYLIIGSMVLPFGIAYLSVDRRLLRRVPQDQQPDRTPAASARPRLLARLPVQMGGSILALEAEDHYVRVHTASGSALILMRFSDAILEMDGVHGERVHRSWWVARAAVDAVRREGRKIFLKLTNGLDIPVTREASANLRRRGWL